MLLKNRELRLALCSRLARRYSEWKAVVLREKAIYHVLNLFRADVSGMLRGEGWIVASAEVDARALAHHKLALPVQHHLLHRDLGVGLDLERVLEAVDVGGGVAAGGAVALG